MPVPHTRTAQLTALIPLGLLIAALACLRVHQTAGHEWALWTALLAVACGTLSAGYLIGHAIPATAAVKRSEPGAKH